MNTKMMLLLGVGAVAAYLLFLRPAKPKAGNSNTVASNNYVATGIAAGTKILGTILQTAGGDAKSTAKVGGGGMVTSYSQLGVPDPGSSSGIITEFD